MSLLLLDTHAFFWWCVGSDLLSNTTHAELLDSNNTVYVSAVTRWEIGLKEPKGKWPEAGALLSGYEALVESYKFIHLPITATHISEMFKFPLSHKDPFDRLLMAQAVTEDLLLVTRDQKIKQILGGRVFW